MIGTWWRPRHDVGSLDLLLGSTRVSSLWRFRRSPKGWRFSGLSSVRNRFCRFLGGSPCRWPRSRSLAALSVRVCHNRLIQRCFNLSLSVTVVQLLSDPLINFYEFNQFLVQLQRKTLIKKSGGTRPIIIYYAELVLRLHLQFFAFIQAKLFLH